MTIHVFAGPSLTREDREDRTSFRWHPPAQAGDLLRLEPSTGDTVCLLDGAFDQRPAVRHKELLWLLSRGVRVLGASSIGALRAAEMDRLGMVGVGAVYRAFADGRLQADDEVALVHAAAERDWRPLSLPLVDCRAVLHTGVRRRWLGVDEARALLAAARRIHFADRDWPGVFDMAGMTGSRRHAALSRLRAVPSQKRCDALACLALARVPPSPGTAPAMVHTSLFEALARDLGLTPPQSSAAPDRAG